MNQKTLNELLAYKQTPSQDPSLLHLAFTANCIVWDVRDPPSRAHTRFKYTYTSASSHLRLLPSEFAQPATNPAVSSLDIVSDILPRSCRICAYNPTGVTVHDVLSTIFIEMHKRIKATDWEEMGKKQRERVAAVFIERCGTRGTSVEDEKSKGVRRVDTLGRCTRFMGMSVGEDSRGKAICVLTLARNS